jgi:hypothetical protein
MLGDLRRQLTAEARLMKDMRRLELRQRIRNYTDDTTTDHLPLREVVYREAHRRASATLVDWVRQPCPATREAFIRAAEGLLVAEKVRRVSEQTRRIA